ncbi:MAG TPA: protein kinase [Gemmataceae bacterium]|jgi:WD40 repeat protein|nr:protein kinase [Gemmataceae bacterium]
MPAGAAATLSPSGPAEAGRVEAVTVAPVPAAATTVGPAMAGYEILGELGRGGMGVVYKARQVQLNRLVALKMILAGSHAGAAELARFRTEGEAVARLQHPNIVQIHEVGEADGLPFFSLEFCPGGSFASKLDGTPLPPGQAAQLVETLARAMHVAHQAGIVHRDLKPANVLLAADGTPKVTDFGLAKKLEGAQGVSTPGGLTASGAVMGTPSYMAPEQAGGKSREIGPAADVYALGAILYECLTGRPPFKAATPLETILQVVADEAVPPARLQPKTPRDLETICLKCLHKEPGRRYGSAEALAGDLRSFLNGEPIGARPVGRAERLWRWCRRNPALAALSALAVAALLSVLALSVVMAIIFRKAAQEDRERLFESLVNEAQAERRAGDRQRSLELLGQAARIRPTDHVRQEAIQTIASSGVRFLSEMPTGDGRRAGDRVFSPVFSPDGKLVAFTQEESFPVGPAIKQPNGSTKQGGNAKPVLQVREFPSGKLLAKRSDFYTPLRFRPRTSHLAIAKDIAGPVTRLWDPVAGNDLGTYQGANPVFSADGACLATTQGKQVRIWDLAQGRKAIPPPRGTPLQFLSERELLLADDGIYRRWDFILGRETYATPKGLVGLAVSANGRLAAMQGRPADPSREVILVWDFIEGKQVAVLPDVGFVPSSVSFSLDDKQLALLDPSHKRMTILVWDLATLSLISRLSSRGSQSSSGSSDQILTWGFPAPSFSPNGALLAARGFRGGRPVLCLWDVETGTEVRALPDIWYSWWRDDGRVLVTLGPRIGEEDRDGGIRLLDTGMGHAQGEKAPPSGHVNLWEVTHPTPTYLLDANVQAASFNGDGSRLAANDLVWEIRKNADGYFLRRSAVATEGLVPVFRGRDEVWAASIDARNAGYATLWQLAPEKRKVVLSRPAYPDIDKQVGENVGPIPQGPYPRAHLLALSPEGELALIASEMGFYYRKKWKPDTESAAEALELWDPIGRKRLAIWNRDDYGENWQCFQFSRDGKRVATGSNKGLKIWNVARGKVEQTLAEDRLVDQVAFSQDGKRVLAVQSGNQVYRSSFSDGRDDTPCWAAVFAVDTGEELRSWEALRREGGWRSSALSPDGQWVVSGGKDGLIRLWDVATGRELARWEAHDAGVTTLIFHPDGKMLVSGGKDGTVKLWNLLYIRKGLAALGLDWPSE